MKPLTLPVDVDGEHLAILDISHDELVAMFGPGIIPSDWAFIFPGPVEIWPLLSDDGQIVVVEYHIAESFVALLANPRDVRRALRALGLAQDRVKWISPRPE